MIILNSVVVKAYILILCIASFVLGDSLDVSNVSDSTPTLLLNDDFASSLFSEGDYYRAVSEYKRLLFFCRDPELCDYYQLRIGQALFLASQYNLVLDWYMSLENKDNLPREKLLYGRALFHMGRFQQSAVAFEARVYSSQEIEIQSKAHYYAGLSYVRLEQLDNAIDCFSDVNIESVFFDRASTYASILTNDGMYSQKDPLVAGVLGVIPGAGYAYTEHYGTALASLALNSLLAWATIDAFQDGDTAAGIVFSVFASGFYIGNITGSIQSANRYNDYQARIFQNQFNE